MRKVLILIGFLIGGCVSDAVYEGYAGYEEPWPAEPVYLITYLPLDEVQAECIRRGVTPPEPGWRILACASVLADPCPMVLPNDVGRIEHDRLLRHEQAHCRGWRHG